jgi:2-polyprenyl-3-methyl-5-hydroxy-6-metoxy-1,4-benzoquinol methylase
MENQQSLDFLSQLWELFGTVREGAAYLAAHPENTQMKADVSAGLRVLCTHLRAAVSCVPEPKELADSVCSKFQILAAEAGGGSVDNVKLSQAVSAFTDLLSQEYIHRLSSVPYLPREQAGPIFNFCAGAPREYETIYRLIFILCEKAAVSMPRESFDWTIRAMEEHPELLSGDHMPHPEYRYRPSKQRTFHRCPICGGEGTPYHRAFAYRMIDFDYPHLPAKLWMRCGGCGNLYTYQYPEELLTQADHPALIRPDPEKALTAVRQANAIILSTWSAILNKLGGYTKGRELLEVGIGEGCLLAVALEMGYAADAVEIVAQSAQEVADILRIPIWNGDFLDYHPDKRYSVIIMGDVIEHVTDPERALRNARELLAEDGVLWLSTPNFEGSFTRMLKFSDPMWLEPYHISYFSFAGIRTLAEKCGFTVREYLTSNRYNGSMELILTKG